MKFIPCLFSINRNFLEFNSVKDHVKRRTFPLAFWNTWLFFTGFSLNFGSCCCEDRKIRYLWHLYCHSMGILLDFSSDSCHHIHRNWGLGKFNGNNFEISWELSFEEIYIWTSWIFLGSNAVSYENFTLLSFLMEPLDMLGLATFFLR